VDRIKRKLTTIPIKGWLWMIIALGLLARLGAVLLMGDRVEVLPGIFDQVSYHTLATRLLDGHGFTFDTQWWPVTQAGEPTAHWSYLYTFYLTAVYTLVGVHPLAARLVQAVAVGVLMPCLAYRLGTALTLNPFHRSIGDSHSPDPFPLHCGVSHASASSLGWRIGDLLGLVAAAWVAFYGYFMYYSAALMTEMFYITAILWSLDSAVRIAYRQNCGVKIHIGHYVQLGIAIGIAVLLRQVYLVFAPFLLARVALTPNTSPTRRGETRNPNLMLVGKGNNGLMPLHRGRGVGIWEKGKGALAAGIVVLFMILPFTWWNYHQFGRFVLLNTNAGYAFFWANHPVHGDDFVPLFTPDMPTYQELIPSELLGLDEAALDQELMQRGVQFVLDDLGRYVRLSLSRIDDHFIFWPKADSSTLSNIVRVASLGVALPFMLLGAGLWTVHTWQNRSGKTLVRVRSVFASPGGLLLLFLVIYVGVHLLSWAGIRYRLPADAVMLIFAAYALVCIILKMTGYRESPLHN
jgi:hypothetical protein